MKIIFAGTAQFAVPSLENLIKSTHEIIAVYTQPDRKSGRGQKVTMSPIKELALKHNLVVNQPSNLRDQQISDKFSEADLLIVVAYGLIIPSFILNKPQYGGINVHGSLLPRWRGAAPIQRAILAGDKITGVSIMQMQVGLDTGPVFKTAEIPITKNDTSLILQEKLAKIGADLLITTLTELSSLKPIEQDDNLANYAAKITKEEGLVDWTSSANNILKMLQAFLPWPGVYTFIAEQQFKILAAKIIKYEDKKPPGMIVNVGNHGIDVATGENIIRILELQFSGCKPLLVKDCLNSKQDLLTPGMILGK